MISEHNLNFIQKYRKEISTTEVNANDQRNSDEQIFFWYMHSFFHKINIDAIIPIGELLMDADQCNEIINYIIENNIDIDDALIVYSKNSKSGTFNLRYNGIIRYSYQHASDEKLKTVAKLKFGEAID